MTTQKQAIKSIKTALSNEGFPLRKYKYGQFYVKVCFNKDLNAIAVEVVDVAYRIQELKNFTHELLYATLCRAGFNARPVQIGLIEIDKPY